MSAPLSLDEARTLGIGPRAVRRLQRRGLAHVRSDGRLLFLPNTSDAQVALVGLGAGVVLMLESAAGLHEWPLASETLQLAVPRSRTGLRWPGAVIHSRGLDPNDVYLVRGLAVTTPEATVLDLARWRGLRPAVIAVDAARRAGQTGTRRMRRALARRVGHPGVRNGALALRLSDSRRQSPLESEFRVLIHEAGLPAPEDQYVVRAGGCFLARADFAWPEAMVVVEIDGYQFHHEWQVFTDDRRRQNELVLAGWMVLRFTAADLARRPDVVVAKVRTALEMRGLLGAA